jgi:hypothetical protein
MRLRPGDHGPPGGRDQTLPRLPQKQLHMLDRHVRRQVAYWPEVARGGEQPFAAACTNDRLLAFALIAATKDGMPVHTCATNVAQLREGGAK